MSVVLPASLRLSCIASSKFFRVNSLLAAADHHHQSAQLMPLQHNRNSPMWNGTAFDEGGGKSDAFCVDQSVYVRPFGDTPDDHLVKYIIDNAHTWQAPFESVIRVKSFGNSSITFDHTIKRADTTAELAKILRTFVRVGSTGRPLKFSSAERDVLEQLKEKGAEETWENWDQDDQEEPNHNHKTTMELTQFHTAMLTTHETNFSGHIDHAHLSRIALTGLQYADEKFTLPLFFQVSYLNQAKKGDLVDIFVGEDKLGGQVDWEIRSKKENGLVIAKGVAGNFAAPEFDSFERLSMLYS